MANNPYVNKVQLADGTSLMDITGTTAVATDVLAGKYFFSASGELTLGTNQGGSGDGYVWQDAQGYVHLSDEEGTQPIYDTLNVSGSGTFTPSQGHAYNSVVVPSGTATAPSTISGTSASVSTGTNTLTLTKTVSVTPSVTTAGYVSSGTAGNASVSLTASVNTRSSSDLSASGDTVTVPSGYYASNASKAVSSGTEGTPTATKGTVSSHSIAVTPSVTNTAGYISGGTKTGTAVSVSASELVSGNLPITQNGNNIDCANYSTVSVNVSGGSPTLITKNITANGTYNASSDNADGYSSVTVNVSGGGGGSWMGSNATKVQTYTDQKVYLKDTAFADWTPVTTQTTLSSATSFPTYTGNYSSYDYYTVYKWHTHFEYNGSQSASYIKDLYWEKIDVLYGYPSGASNIASNTKTTFGTTSIGSRYIIDYITSGGVQSYSSSATTYGVYPSFSTPTITGSGTINTSFPTVYARCNSTYFSTASASYVDKDASYYEITAELWSVDSGTSAAGKLVDDVHSMWANGGI